MEDTKVTETTQEAPAEQGAETKSLSPAEALLDDLIAEEQEATEVEDKPTEGASEDNSTEEPTINQEARPSGEAEEKPEGESEEDPTTKPKDETESGTKDEPEEPEETFPSEAEKEALKNRLLALQGEPNEEDKEDPEEELDEEKFNEEFYSNPAAYIRNLSESIADKKLKARLAEIQDELNPLLEQSKAAKHKQTVKDVITQFFTDHEDAKEYFEDIAKYIKEGGLPPEDPRSYMDALRESKLKRQADELSLLRQGAKGKTLDEYLLDEDSLSKIVANDNIKARIIENYLKELKDGSKPATIVSGGSTHIPGEPPVKPATMNDARVAFLNSIRK